MSGEKNITKQIDKVVVSRGWGYLIFLAVLYLMFYTTFTLGQYPMNWIESLMHWLEGVASSHMTDGPLKDLLVDGVIAGVGGVIVFLPNILILYLFISFMEGSGYMSRVAYIMDRIMRRMGLHGSSFIPMIMGFGCNIPAIMATRSIEDRKSRIITMLIIPLMSCSGRLPVYIIMIGAFFPQHHATVLFSLYLLGIVMSVLLAHFFSKYIVKGQTSPFSMKLTPYHVPSFSSVCFLTWDKGKEFLRKMGTTILAASIIIWALSYFPHHAELPADQQMEQSYIGKIGKVVEPVIRPCGFSWKEGVSILSGIGSKEVVASTMSVLYANVSLRNSGMTPYAAFSFLVFVLLYMPCIPACVAIHKESGRHRWALFAMAYTTALAWITSTAIYQLCNLFL